MYSNEHDGSASVWVLSLLLLFILSILILLSALAVSVSHNRASTAADLIAFSGCDEAHRIAVFNDSELVTCNDDGVTVSVETRTRINLPLRVLPLFAHARAQAVHEL